MYEHEIRVSVIGTAKLSKSMFLPYLTGQMEITPPIAEAMRKCGYIGKATEKKLVKEYQRKRK